MGLSRRAVLLSTLSLAMPNVARASTLRAIVTSGAGSATDILARALGAAADVPVVIVDEPRTRTVAAVTADIIVCGHLFMADNREELLDTWQPACLLAETNPVLLTRPDCLPRGTCGVVLRTLAGNMVEELQRYGMPLRPILYPAGSITARGLTDLLGGHTDCCAVNLAGTVAHIQAGTLSAFGIAASKRYDVLPAVPTMTERGYPLTLPFMFGVFARTSVLADRVVSWLRVMNVPPVVMDGYQWVGAGREALIARMQALQ